MRIKKRGRPEQLEILSERSEQLEMDFEVTGPKFIRVGTTIIRIWETPGYNPGVFVLVLR